MCCFFLLAGTPASGASHYFDIFSPALQESDQGLIVNVRCSVEEESVLRALLKDGAVIELGIDLELEKTRSYWLNSTVASKHFTSTLRHNPLTREFSLVTMQNGEPVVSSDRNLTRLLQTHWEHLQFTLLSSAELKELEPDRQYLCEVTLRLYHAEVPPWLESSMGFWSPEIIAPQTKSLLYP